MAEHRIKNIARAIRTYRVALGLTTSNPSSCGDTPLGALSVAVLPLYNMSADPEQEHFADGMAEDLITDLAKVDGLVVAARNSTFVYKGRPVNVPQVGRELGVRYVVEGSVRKIGNRVHITAQLIDSANGTHVWADRYDRDLADAFAVQDEVANRIVGAVRLHLTQRDGRPSHTASAILA